MAWLPEKFKKKAYCNDVIDNNNPHWIRARITVKVMAPEKDACTRACTFLIPFAADSIERINSLLIVVTHILANTDSKIIIKFADIFDPSCNKNLDYRTYFVGALIQRLGTHPVTRKRISERVHLLSETRAPGTPFHRMKYINDCLRHATTDIVANLDSDVLINSCDIRTCIELLLLHGADVVYPPAYGTLDGITRIWDGYYMETGFSSLGQSLGNKDAKFFGNGNSTHVGGTTVMIEKLISKDDLCPLKYHTSNKGTLGSTSGNIFVSTSPAAFGHAIFLNRKKYISSFGENEEFISWGAEDVERFVRFIKLGLKVVRANVPVYHLEHPRGQDSSTRNPHFEANEKLWEKLQVMNPDELREYYEATGYAQNQACVQPAPTLFSWKL